MPIISAETPDVEKSITAKEEKADSTLNGFECETPVIDPSSGTDYELSTKMPEIEIPVVPDDDNQTESPQDLSGIDSAVDHPDVDGPGTGTYSSDDIVFPGLP